MVKFNPGLSEILGDGFLIQQCNSSLQNTVEPLLRDTVMITHAKCYYKQYKYHRKVKYKNGTKFNLGLAPIGLSDTRPREVSLIHVQLTY